MHGILKLLTLGLTTTHTLGCTRSDNKVNKTISQIILIYQKCLFQIIEDWLCFLVIDISYMSFKSSQKREK